MQNQIYNKRVYLSFDDGIHPGTEEVLSILQKTNIRATFFLTGINLFYMYRRDREKCLSLLKNIYNNHIIGNHSFSHAYNFYSAYYTKGLLIDNTGKKVSVLEDFKKNDCLLNLYLNMILNENNNNQSISYVRNNKRLARLPGRNTWCLIMPSNREKQSAIAYRKYDNDSKKSADELFTEGYQIFGWDTEWKMSFDFYHDAIKIKNEMLSTQQINYNNYDDVYPDFDMYSYNNTLKDRLLESWEEVGKRIIDMNKNKIVLLMHDRAFRKNCFKGSNKIYYRAVDQLELFVNYLKKYNIIFDTLTNY